MIYIWVRSWNCTCLVTWFCYHLIAKPGNKTAAVPWPDPYESVSRPVLVQIMACHLFNAKPQSQPTPSYYELYPWEYISVKLEWKYNDFHTRKWIWKCHYVSAKWRPLCLSIYISTNWGWRKRVVIWQTLFSNSFTSMKSCILIHISLKYDTKCYIDNKPALIEIMACRSKLGT